MALFYPINKTKKGTFCDTDINECSSNPCLNGATCVNGLNQWSCNCVPGFNGTNCGVDVNKKI